MKNIAHWAFINTTLLHKNQQLHKLVYLTIIIIVIILCPQSSMPGTAPGIELNENGTLSSDHLFIFMYDPSFRSSMIPILGLFPSILPCKTCFNNPSPLVQHPNPVFLPLHNRFQYFSAIFFSLIWQ